MLLSKATYSTFRLYIFCQYVCSLGIEPTTFGNAMLYHWATGHAQDKHALTNTHTSELEHACEQDPDLSTAAGQLPFSPVCHKETYTIVLPFM